MSTEETPIEVSTESQSRKPSKKTSRVQYTLCVPSTCISNANASNLQQVTHVAYQIAKAACTYNVGEIVVLQVPNGDQKENTTTQTSQDYRKESGTKRTFSLDDEDNDITMTESESTKSTGNKKNKESPYDHSSMLLATLLQFFVTPPYLVKSTFKKDMLQHFSYANKLPKISTLPFMNNNRVYDQYKEGLTVYKKKQQREKTSSGKVKKTKKSLNTTKFVNIGEDKLLELATEVPTNVRVTVNLKTQTIVSPIEAYNSIGAKSSFGYHVRIAKSFISMFTESGYPDGYDSSIYINCGDYFLNSVASKSYQGMKEVDSASINEQLLALKGKNAKAGLNVLIVCGKWLNMIASFEDCKSELEGVTSPKEMFDGFCEIPSGTRVEDGALIALTKLN